MLSRIFGETFSNYTQGGAAWMMGFEPVVGQWQTNGRTGVLHQGYNSYWNLGAGVPDPVAPSAATGWTKWGRIGGSVAGAGFSIYNVAHGFSEGGLGGAKDAAVWDLATASAITRFAYGAVGTAGPSRGYGIRERMAMLGAKPAGSLVQFGGGGGIGAGIVRSMGAGVGASVGQAVLGTPGAFLGGYIGAAPIRFAATHPLLAGGMAVAGATAAVGYGTYSVVKGVYTAGYNHRQRQRGINTSGSMAAFMTSGAHTMRQRAVQAIHKSHLNARSALGQEAGFMHMPSKNYHSMYR